MGQCPHLDRSKHLPSGYDLHSHGKSPFLISKPVNHLFLWAMASMAMLDITRWYRLKKIGKCLMLPL